MKVLLNIVLYIVTLSGILFAQKPLSETDLTYFKKYEDSLVYYQKKLYSTKNDSLAMKINRQFIKVWDEVLSNQLSFEYPFDSIKEVGRLYSPDRKFRIINWNFEFDDGTHSYFGFVQSLSKKKSEYELYELHDYSNEIKNPETHSGNHQKWFGALYYKIIPCSNYYVLLGLDLNDRASSKKLIEIISFKENGEPLFGKPVFKFPKKDPKRIIFEYASGIVMTLKYIKEKELIIFDHLAPTDSFLEGQYQFYGPDFTYDGFYYSKGKWKFEEDIDVKNIKNNKDNLWISPENAKERTNKKEKPVYTPR